ncbi:leucoanthocyanidin dioxygenase [Aspergillus ibericus CBS 121593]|uniref:Leucoanthocyanidin dioxygenase n=1 Tax=Aspergillus ibericus CBS 121593 TaxID=1448316 RepID=A0A395GMU5_9EURO|nr:leucoanthocyanidin dioxygenase [Aspergillus ibericus CBS 121593]RAK96799.1 leucoanthocyanidin dioxygenase [Aspergillus ibericus CBS 121593]
MTTRYVSRTIPRISLRDFDQRIDQITAELVDAAENVGFFTLIDHGIANEEIENMFSTAERFFSLSDDIKATVPWNANNVGWEKKAQIRPSTGQPDTKESYQLQFGENMIGLWMDDKHLPGFKATSLSFMHRVQEVSERLMRCFARGLGFDDDFFIKCHDVSRPNEQTTMRLLHYYALPSQPDGKTYHRAGAHADWDFLTLLFQKEGQSGLEICPGREVVTEFGIGDEWTRVEAHTGDIVCNIGDLLMSWSDDRFKSTFHRVKAPSEPGDYYGDRYSIAYFNQPCKDALIQGPQKKYPLVTGEQFNANAMKRNFAALQEKLKLMEQVA